MNNYKITAKRDGDGLPIVLYILGEKGLYEEFENDLRKVESIHFRQLGGSMNFVFNKSGGSVNLRELQEEELEKISQKIPK